MQKHHEQISWRESAMDGVMFGHGCGKQLDEAAGFCSSFGSNPLTAPEQPLIGKYVSSQYSGSDLAGRVALNSIDTDLPSAKI